MRHSFFFLFSLLASCLPADDYPQQFEGSFEEWVEKRFELISLFLPPDPVILQAGAYYGSETLYFAKCWPQSKILAFEPNPHAFQTLLSGTINIKNIHAYNLALNDDSGYFPFFICYGSTGKDVVFEHASSLLRPSASMAIHYQGPVIPVSCVILDDWCRENKWDRLDFACLNLQGAELQVLKSSPEVLKTLTCISIHTNFFPFRFGTTQFPELRNFLENAGFQLLAHWYREGLDGDAIFVKNDFFCNREVEEYLKTNRVDGKYRRYFEPFFRVNYDLDEDDKDTLKGTIKRGLPYEGNIGVIIHDLTQPGSTAIDIGSHIGVHTVTMSRKVGPKGAVLAFEPTKKTYMEMLDTLAINDCTNVIPICKALGEKPQTVFLKNGHIEESGDRIETIALDSLKVDNLSLIKMDVENYEYAVLKGAEQTILRNKPVILFECWIGADYEKSDAKIKANFDRVISLIESYGYEIYVIYCNDFIAFPIESTSEYKAKFKRLDLNAFDLGLS
jgi:FkbM family methyltransferase